MYPGICMALIVAPPLSTLMQLSISRAHEFNADIAAACLTKDPEGLASALKKIDIYSRSIFERIFMPHSGMPDFSLLRTHPKMDERITRLMQYIKENKSHSAYQEGRCPAFRHSIDRIGYV